MEECWCVCGLNSQTRRTVPMLFCAFVPPGSACCWPAEATSAGLDGPRGTQSAEARWLASRSTKKKKSLGRKTSRCGTTSKGCVSLCCCLCDCARVRGPRPIGHGEQSGALGNHSILSKASQEGKRGMCESVSIISLLSKSDSRTSVVMMV